MIKHPGNHGPGLIPPLPSLIEGLIRRFSPSKIFKSSSCQLPLVGALPSDLVVEEGFPILKIIDVRVKADNQNRVAAPKNGGWSCRSGYR